jgi:hypothetical protein
VTASRFNDTIPAGGAYGISYGGINLELNCSQVRLYGTNPHMWTPDGTQSAPGNPATLAIAPGADLVLTGVAGLGLLTPFNVQGIVTTVAPDQPCAFDFYLQLSD